MQINTDDLTLKQLKEIAAQFGSGLPSTTTTPHPYRIGENYFIRTVTHHYTGKLVAVCSHELVLVDAAWIADDGRFAEAIAKGKFNEVEPYPEGREVIIGRGSIIDACLFEAELPRSQK